MSRDTHPFLLTREEAAHLCRLSPSAFALWVKNGRLPAALPGTRRWHRDALKGALDRLAGVQSSMAAAASSSAYDEWKASRAQRKA